MMRTALTGVSVLVAALNLLGYRRPRGWGIGGMPPGDVGFEARREEQPDVVNGAAML